jgi:hypothetical protein
MMNFVFVLVLVYMGFRIRHIKDNLSLVFEIQIVIIVWSVFIFLSGIGLLLQEATFCYSGSGNTFFGLGIGKNAYIMSFWMGFIRNTIVSAITFMFSICINRREKQRVNMLQDKTIAG